MMLQNRFTGLYLLSDLSVGPLSISYRDSAPFIYFFSPLSKPNLDRCSSKEGIKIHHESRFISNRQHWATNPLARVHASFQSSFDGNPTDRINAVLPHYVQQSRARRGAHPVHEAI